MKKKLKRIVVKIGSSSLTHDGGKLNLTAIERYLRQLIDLKNQGKEVLLVSSGAVAAGMAELGIKEKVKSIPEKQGIAAIGQASLMSLYNRLLKEYGELGAQILLTADDLMNRNRFLNAFNTLESLLTKGVIPIINENDTVATQEIKFGDNDTLSARVAGLVEAQLLIILSDIEGLYNGNPHSNAPDLKLINTVTEITPEIEQYAEGSGSNLGTGGMQTKLTAAKIATQSGVTMVIAPSYINNIIPNIIKMVEEDKDYSIGTTFFPLENSLPKRKQWLYFNLKVRGSIKVDAGAETALRSHGKSLLPGGIIEVKGNFISGEAVKILNQHNTVIGRGLVNYSVEEIQKIKGHNSEDIIPILGYLNHPEVIHRDNLVIEGGQTND